MSSLPNELLFEIERIVRISLSPQAIGLINNHTKQCQSHFQLLKCMGEVVLSGGSTMFPGISDRLHTELQPLLPSGYKLKVSDTGDIASAAAF